jgi:hypothetical protein
MPHSTGRLDEVEQAILSGREYEYGIRIDKGFNEGSGSVFSVELIKPDATSVPLIFINNRFELQIWYFSFEDLSAAFPEGEYSIHVVYDDASTEDIPFTVPSYAESDFAEGINGELVWNGHYLNLTWVPTTDEDVFYTVTVSDLNREIEIWDNDLQPDNTTLAFGSLIAKNMYDCRVDVKAIKIINDSDIAVSLISGSSRWSFREALPVYEVKATKCTVVLDKGTVGSVSLAGTMNASEADFVTSGKAVVTLDANAMPNPLTFTFPITDVTFRNGKYDYSQTVNGSPLVFKYNTQTRAFVFSAKKTDLKGMGCPVRINVAIGNQFSSQIELDETLVNGPEKSCPPQLIMRHQRSLSITQARFITGKKANTDTLSVQGTFTIDSEIDLNEAFVVALGSQSFTIPGGLFTYRNGVYRCNNVPADEGGLLSVKLDTNRCLFSLSIRKAKIENNAVSDFALSVFGCPLAGFAHIDLGTAHTYWQLTHYDQRGAAWQYDSGSGIKSAEIGVFEQWDEYFQVYEEHPEQTIRFFYAKGIDISAHLCRIVIDSNRLGSIDVYTDLEIWPSFLRPGQIHVSTSELTGTMAVLGQPVEIVNGTASATTTVNASLVKARIPDGTYSTVRFNENWTLQGDLQYSGERLGRVVIKLQRQNFALPDRGIVKQICTGTIAVHPVGRAPLRDKISGIYVLAQE